MKILTAIKDTFLVIAVVLLNSISFAGHSAAMSTMSHDMGNMKHTVSDSTTCATLCRTAVVAKDEHAIRNDENEDDDEPTPPFYVKDQSQLLDNKSKAQSLYSDKVKPPPKIPVYILYGVFRA